MAPDKRQPFHKNRTEQVLTKTQTVRWAPDALRALTKYAAKNDCSFNQAANQAALMLGRLEAAREVEKILKERERAARDGTSLDPGSAQFPLMDVGLISSQMGVTLAVLGYILGGITILGLGLLGQQVAGGVGAVVASALGLGLTAALNLFDDWIIVLVFLGAVTAVVLVGRGGGE